MGSFESWLKGLNFVLTLVVSSAVKATIIFTVSVSILCTAFIPSLADKISAMTIYSIILLIALILAVISGLSLFMHLKNFICRRIKEARIAEEEAVKRDAEKAEFCRARECVRQKLLSLSASASALLMQVYFSRSHAAYIPCDNSDAEELYRLGFLTGNREAKRRGDGYDYACNCYYYRLSNEIVPVLEHKNEELGEKWGYESNTLFTISKYQRAGKPVVLEHVNACI